MFQTILSMKSLEVMQYNVNITKDMTLSLVSTKVNIVDRFVFSV